MAISRMESQAKASNADKQPAKQAKERTNERIEKENIKLADYWILKKQTDRQTKSEKSRPCCIGEIGSLLFIIIKIIIRIIIIAFAQLSSAD